MLASLLLLAGSQLSSVRAAELAPGTEATVEPLPLKLDRNLSERNAVVTEGRPIFGTGERMTGRSDRETTLEGNAQLRRAGTVVHGDRITYYVPDDEIAAVGNVRIAREGNIFTGPQLQLRLDANEGFMLSPSYYLSLYKGKGSAERIDFLGPQRVALRDATYTTCAASDPDWYLKADSMNVDESTQEGSGVGGSLVFLGRTILKAPYFSFPLGDERRSGFLPPTFSLVSKTGAEILLPYYFSIAPNRDFTLYNRLMATRGLQLGGQFRYLEPTAFGETRFEYNAHDSSTNTPRYQYSSLHTFGNYYGWAGGWNVKGVSDDNYFVDYARSIISSSERSLPRDFQAFRPQGDWLFNVRAVRYQNILDARATPPYERLPQLTATWTKRELPAGFELISTFDATRFSRPFIESAAGTRVLANPVLSYPIIRPGWFVTPKLGWHWTSYQLDQNPGYETSLTRSVPTLSLDSGLVFERKTQFFGRDVNQTLEPRLFYVRTPYRNQSALPVFDTAVADFNFSQLFSENTFIGNDRIADVNQLTAAVVSRFINPGTGSESLRLAVGQRFYFSNQRVTIPNVANSSDSRSDILLAGSMNLGDGRTLDAGLQYAVADSSLPRANIAYRQVSTDGRIFNVGLRYLRDELGQLDTSWRQPLNRRWTSLGRINYSWLKHRLDAATGQLIEATPGVIEGLLGFEYLQDCWTFRFVLQRFVTAAATPTTALFFQLDLNGLGRLGSNPFEILRRNIPGYQLPNERPSLPSKFFGYE